MILALSVSTQPLCFHLSFPPLLFIRTFLFDLPDHLFFLAEFIRGLFLPGPRIFRLFPLPCVRQFPSILAVSWGSHPLRTDFPLFPNFPF